MITKVSAKGFKGLEFEQPLPRLTLLCGKNGVGKTARTEALMLTVHGFVPGVAKKNADIMSAYGSGDKLFVGIETSDRKHFLRRFAKGEGDSVSQDLLLNRKKASKEDFARALGAIRVFDLGAFLDLSDQKKIDAIFSLFPPAGDIGDLDAKIEAKKAAANKYQADIRDLGKTIARLTTGRAEINLPSGTLAETTGKISETEAQIAQARKNIEAAKIEKARAEAKEKADREAAEKAEKDRVRLEAEAKAKAESDLHVKLEVAKQEGREEAQADAAASMPSVCTPAALSQRERDIKAAEARLMARMPNHPPAPNPEESIHAIIDTMKRTGCSACAAQLVCLRELKKYRKEQAA